MLGQSLTTRLVVLLTACIALTLSATTAVEYRLSRAQILAEVEARAETTVAQAVNDLEVRLASLEESTNMLAQIIVQRDYSEEQLTALLRAAVDGRDDLFGAALALDPRWSSDRLRGFAPYFYYREGQLAYTDLAQAYDYVLNAWFREPASGGQPVWTEPYFDEGGGNVHMATYAVPMYREIGGKSVLYGVVTADITLRELQYYLDRMQLGPSGFGFMLSRSGKLMAAPDPDDLLRPLLQILPQGQDVTLWGGLLTDVAGGGNVTADTPCGEIQGRCIIKLAPLQSTRWPVGVYYSEWEMLAPLRSYLVKTAASAALTLALLIAGIIWVSRRITRPLTSLAAATTDIASGNFHNTLPAISSRDELGRLVDAFSLMQDNLQQYVTRLETETASRNRLLGELSAATAIQMSMLPGRGRAYVDEPRFRLWAALRPAKSVGGDLYTFHLAASNRLFIGVGDVSDKGVPAALFMARAMTLLQQHAHTGQAPDQIMCHLNDELVEGNDNCMFVTLFLGWLDLESLILTFTSGGHTPPSLLRNGQCSSLGQDQGPALGLSENLEFPVNRLQLQPGDTLAVFTDGVDEAFNGEGEQLGLDAFNQVLAAPSQNLEALGQSCFEAIDRHAGETAQSDDITILLLQLRVSTQPGAVLQLPTDKHAIRSLMRWLDEQLQAAPLEEQVLAEIRLVAEEVVTNILKYAGLGEGARIEVRLDRDTDTLALEFSDAGIPFDPLVEARRSELGSDIESAAIGGLGVHLFEALTDEQTYRRVDGKNHLRLLKRLH